MRFSVILLYTAFSIFCTPVVSADSGNSSWCGTLMCVSASTNGNTITYELTALNQLGWMSIGFGAQMNSTPLVIMWPNADGSVTLSQRQASGHTAPVPVASPPRTATVSQSTDLSDATSPILAFDIPQSSDGDDDQIMIWAFGVERPDSESDADIVQHLDAGTFVLAARSHDGGGDGDGDGDDNTSPMQSSSSASSAPSSSSSSLPSLPIPAPTLTSNSPSSSSANSSLSSSSLSSTSSSSPTQLSDSTSIPSPTQLPDSSAPNTSTSHITILMIAHASLSFLGFAVFLPLSALFVRWSRTFIDSWRRIHWLSMLLLAAPCMFVGWTLGPILVTQEGHHHVVNEHQICGVALFALCLVQMSLGALIHLQRPKNGEAHPPRNVIHVALGLFIIGFSFFETKTGISRDRLLSDDTRKILTILCILWAVVVAVAYLIGLGFLRKQLHQERLGWHLTLAERPPPASSHTRSSAPLLHHGSSTQSSAPSPSQSSSRFLRWLHTRIDDSPHGTDRAFSHQSVVSSSVPDIRPEASVVTLVEMRELQSTLPISIRVRDAPGPMPCSELVE